MKQHIFAIYDSKAFSFISPFFFPTPEMAIRIFQGCANEPGHMFCKHPHDFNLYHIGEFDDSTGELEAYELKINLGLAISYKNPSLATEMTS